jgi:outer membrane protein TolC
LKLRQFRETVKTTRELLVLEQQSYSILEAEYRNGRAAYLDLITNLNSLIDARSKFMTSYFGFKKQQMLYAFHKGDLYAELKQK